MYVTVGASKGVKVGDYMRLFRYQGIREEYAADCSQATVQDGWLWSESDQV